MHSVKIKSNEGVTHLSVDGIPMEKGLLQFQLDQEGGCPMVLHLTFSVDEIDIEAEGVEIKKDRP